MGQEAAGALDPSRCQLLSYFVAALCRYSKMPGPGLLIAVLTVIRGAQFSRRPLLGLKRLIVFVSGR
jgi:hypothetical protein